MAKNKNTNVLGQLTNAGNNAVGMINRLDEATGKFQKGRRQGSIVKAAQGNVFEFPVFISSGIPVDYATATSSLLEQIYASYLQMAISINPVVDADSVKNNMQFAGLKTDTNKYLEYTDMSYAHDACHAVYQEGAYRTEFDMISVEDADARLINEAVDHQPLSEFDHFFQEAVGDNIDDHLPRVPMPVLDANGQIEIPWRPSGEYVTQAELRERLDGLTVDVGHGIESALGAWMYYVTRNHLTAPSVAEINNAGPAAGPTRVQRVNTAINNGLDTYNSAMGAVNATANAINNVATLGDRIKQSKYKTQIDKYNADHLEDNQKIKQQDLNVKTANALKAPQYVNDKACEKLNTMKPLLMQVTLSMINKDDTIQPINYIIGVKTHNRVVPSSVLPEVAKYPLKEMDKISRKIKWRAGELKFLKDIVFRINEKKQTAADSRDPKRKWYRRLYELAHMKGDAPAAAVVQGKSIFASFIRDKQGKSKMMNGVIPNATIVMSQADVDNIKNATDIDLLKGSVAKEFCGELFLICLVIIDTDAESVKLMLPDMNDDYEVHSLASINKQLATLDTAGTKTRDMFKLLG